MSITFFFVSILSLTLTPGVLLALAASFPFLLFLKTYTRASRKTHLPSQPVPTVTLHISQPQNSALSPRPRIKSRGGPFVNQHLPFPGTSFSPTFVLSSWSGMIPGNRHTTLPKGRSSCPSSRSLVNPSKEILKNSPSKEAY